MFDQESSPEGFLSDQAIFDARVAKRRRTLLLNLVGNPLSAAAWELARGRGRASAQHQANKNFASVAVTTTLYELATGYYRRSLSDEVEDEGLADRHAELLGPIALRELGYYALAIGTSGVARKYFETRSVAAAARRAGVFAGLYSVAFGMMVIGRKYADGTLPTKEDLTDGGHLLRNTFDLFSKGLSKFGDHVDADEDNDEDPDGDEDEPDFTPNSKLAQRLAELEQLNSDDPEFASKMQAIFDPDNPKHADKVQAILDQVDEDDDDEDEEER